MLVHEKVASKPVEIPLRTSLHLILEGNKSYKMSTMLKLIMSPHAPKGDSNGNYQNKWCKHHKNQGNHTDEWHHLKWEIEKLI